MQKIAFIFPGQGGQQPGMGRQLTASEPSFRASLERTAEVIREEAGWSLFEEMDAAPHTSRLAEPGVAQPYLYALQIALADHWRSRGVRPSAVIGHSMGELAASVSAGALEPEEGARIICRQGALLDEVRGHGTMASVGLPADEVDRLLESFADGESFTHGEIVVAGVLSPRTTVLSGAVGPLETLLGKLRRQEIFCSRVAVECAAHSPQVDSLVLRLEAQLADLEPRPAKIPMISTVSGEWLSGQELNPAYWRQNLRQMARVDEAVRRLVESGCETFVEIGPHPVLLPAIGQVLGAGRGVLLPSMRRGEEEGVTLRESHAALQAPHRPAGQAPSGRAEDMLRYHAAQVLGRPSTELTRLDGLDSLQAVQIQHRLEASSGLNVPLTALLEGLEVPRIAERINKPSCHLGSAMLRPRQRPKGEISLAPNQQALWYLYRLAPESAAYNVAFAFRINAGFEEGSPGVLDVDALKRACTALVRRHPALRTTFHEPAGQPLQRVHPSLPIDFAVDQLEAPGEVVQRFAEAAAQPFDLAHGPLLRVRVLAGADTSALLIATHHIGSDLWSMEVLFRDLGALYTAEIRQGDAELAVLPLTYGDWVDWQAERLAGPEGDRLRSFWRSQLEDAPNDLDLPTDRPRPAVRQWRGSTVELRLSQGFSKDLTGSARDHGTTLFVVLTSALQGLLHRLTGRRDLLVATPTSGRESVQLEGLIGYFVQPIALRANLSGNPSFADLVARTRRTALDAFAHQGFSLPLVAQLLRLERDPGRPTLAQVLFALEQVHDPGLEGLAAAALNLEGGRSWIGDLELSALRLPDKAAQFDLSFFAAELDGTIALSLAYDRDLFETTTAHRWLESYRTLLAAAVEDPGRHLADLPWLRPAELHQTLAEPECTARIAEPPSGGLFALFVRTAARAPEAIGLVSGSEHWSYAALEERARRLAASLHAQGAGPETRIGIHLKRTARMAHAVLAIAAAGGVAVPLAPSDPPARRAQILEEARPLLVLTEDGAKRPEGRSTSVVLDALLASPPTAAAPRVRSEQLAYVLYTSGSTGRPKGVAMPHRALTHLFAWQHATSTTPRRTLQLAPLSFDVAFQEMFSTWTAGATLVLAPPGTRRDPEALIELLTRAKIRRLFLPAVALEQLAEAGCSRTEEPPLAEIVSAGETLRVGPGLVAWLERLGGANPGNQVELHNHYGPTESHVVTSWALHGAPRSWPTLPAIGRPIAGVHTAVLDRHGQALPLGIAGELQIGGRALARGYLGQPAQTAQLFRPDPFGRDPGGRLYATGDLVRRRVDGALEHLGRLDRQIKIRGFRVEPREIEAVLATHPDVASAVVLAPESAPGERHLEAWVVRRDTELTSESKEGSTGGVTDKSTDAPALRAYLTERLPAFMVPPRWRIVRQLPRTATGKVDRRALERRTEGAQPRHAHASAAPYVPPRDALEQTLVEIVSEVLDLERIGVYDDFFDLGGHSLLVTRVAARVAAVLRVEIPLVKLFGRLTVARLSALVRRLHTAMGPSPPPLVRVPRRGGSKLPLSFGQRRLWFLHQLEPESPAYNMSTAFELRGTLNLAALEAAFLALGQRHEILRTTFHRQGGRPHQAIAGRWPGRLATVDLTGLPEPRRDLAAQALGRALAWCPFDLERGPLLQPLLARHTATRHRLIFHLHHIAFDGWSYAVLHRDLGALYSAACQDHASTLPGLGVQYADFATWQRDWLRGAILAAEMEAWRRELRGAPPVSSLPFDRPPATRSHHRGARCRRTSSQALLERARDLCRERGVTLFMALGTTFFALLRRLTDQLDLCLGIPIANRRQAQLEDLLGFFAGTLVLRGDLTRTARFVDLLAQVHERALRAYAHQDAPFEKLVEELSPQRRTRRNPIFQILFAFQNAPSHALHLDGLDVCPAELDAYPVRFELELHLHEEGSRLCCDWLYATDLFDPTTIQRLAEGFLRLLEAAVETPESYLDALAVLGPAQTHQLLVEWNDTRATASEPPAGVHHLVARRAMSIPHSIALSAPGKALSYGQLAARATALARRLRDLGAASEERVAVLMAPSTERVVVLLGVLSSGAAYVPLDPEQPSIRLTAALEDCAPCLLLHGASSLAFEPPEGCRACHFEALARPTDMVPRTGLDNASDPESLAYVIYTSGSTGRPKGVQISHGALLNFLRSMAQQPGLGTQDVLLAVTTVAFDIAALEVFLPLLAGARLEIAERETTVRGAALARRLAETRATVMQATPATWQMLLAAGWSSPTQRLRVFCGGEALPASLAERLIEAGAQVWNLYGPTETTVWSTLRRIEAPRVRGGRRHPMPLGRPIANTAVYVLDRRLRPRPLGCIGEVAIGGAGLMRGYLARPALCAEKLVPDPWAALPGSRLFLTGDLARRRRDGDLVFLGRRDHQVKIRGHRVELGEIESVLSSHPEVREAAVVLHAEGDQQRLVAYLSPSEGPDQSAPDQAATQASVKSASNPAEGQHLDAWQVVWQEIYQGNRRPTPQYLEGAADPEGPEDDGLLFDISGWVSSYTGEPIPRREMREWVQTTVERILSLSPRQVLEIGCGTGLLASRLAARCERYTATDFSPAAVEQLRDALDLPQLELRVAAADDLDMLAAGVYDTVILSSVVQYFPSTEYLLRVLRGALRATAPGGRIFVGDVRHQGLLELFYLDRELSRAAEDTDLATLRQRIARLRRDEEELVLAPAFFNALSDELPRVSGVRILAKRGRFLNELTRFRYDVVLELDREGAAPMPELDWDDVGASLEGLRHALETRRPAALWLRRFPNARLAELARLRALLEASNGQGTAGELRLANAHSRAGEAPPTRDVGVEPAALEELVPGYRVEVGWSEPSTQGEGSGDLAALFYRDSGDADVPLPPPPAAAGATTAASPWANAPLRTWATRRLVPRLRQHLARHLPRDLRPTRFVVLDALPRGGSGKVDRAALPSPESTGPRLPTPQEAPRTRTERGIADIWRQVLDLERVGLEDNFFDLGGHSLLLPQVADGLRQHFGAELSLLDLFRHPTIRALARHLSTLRDTNTASAAADPEPVSAQPTAPPSPPAGRRRSRAMDRQRILRRRARGPRGQAEDERE